jgi:alpha-ribazole phosphatase
MEIYLIRHTSPAVAKGICYGQTDLDLTSSFEAEADIIRAVLPDNIIQVHTSPLQRCLRLAERLFATHTIHHHEDLKELNCGEWEMCAWDDIPRADIDPWMNDFVNVSTPGGESYVQLYERTTTRFQAIRQEPLPAAIVTHGGVIRSILSHITDTPLIDSFKIFALHYGCVVKITTGEIGLEYEILSNIPVVSERHKPSYF